MIELRFNTFTLLMGILLMSACEEEQQDGNSIDPGIPLTLEENLVIESGAEGSEAPFLTFVNELAVDQEGNIYVYVGTDGINEIYKYNQEGAYVYTLGREGRGPGEHRDVTTMYVDSENRLITADFENARITLFDASGEVLRNEPTPGISRVVQIREMPDDRYVLTGWNEEQQAMIHLTSREFTRLEESMGGVDREIPWFESEIEKRFLTNQAGKVAAAGEQGILFVPSTYPGKMHYYSSQGNGWQWERSIEGYENIDPPVVFGSRDDSPPRIDAMLMMRGGRAVIIMQHSVSFGLYPLQDGTYVHISYRFPESGWNASGREGGSGGRDISQKDQEGALLVIERFSDSLELLQYTVTDTLNLGVTQRKRPFWVDRSGQLYLADNSNDSSSVVRRFQIEGLGLD